jgi:hypothetical protein
MTPTDAGVPPAPFAVRDRSVTHAVIELFGGDNNLSSFVLEDMGEMAAGMRGPFATLALADFAGTGASAIEVTGQGSQVLESLGEIDTGDPETLAGFLARALVSYSPATRKAIGFWDHGTGVFDENDPSETILARGINRVPRARRSRSLPARKLFVGRAASAAHPHARAMLHDTTNGGVLTNREARGVLKAAFARSGAGQVDLLFSDTCLNGMIEVLDELRDFAAVVVGSEDLEPGDGWDYFEWFSRMSDAPPQDGLAWGAQAVRAFAAGYAGRPDAFPCTLGAFRSDQGATAAFTALVERCDALGAAGFGALRAARDAAQAFANRDTYDLRDFATRLKADVDDAALRGACDALLIALAAARVDSVALGDQVADAHGLAFWFPNNRYAFDQVEPTYRELQFHKASGWADYLKNQFHPV